MKDSIKRVQSKLACFAERENFRLKGKKFFYLMAMAITAVGFTACADDKTQEVSLIVGEDNAKEVTINRLGGVIEVPIVTNTSWTASVPEDCDWVRVITTEAEGSGKLIVSTDYYSPDNTEDRRTTLTIVAGNKTQTIRIRQYLGLKDGENDNATVLTDAWGETALGMGANIFVREGASENALFKGNAVLSPNNAKYIAAQSMMYNRLFVSSTDAEDIGEEGVNKERNSKTDTLGIRASVNVTYGLFKLKIAGHYKSNEREVNNKLSYEVDYQAPRSAAWVGAEDLVALATTPSNDLGQEMKNLQMLAITPGFDKLRKKIIKEFDNTYKNTELPNADSTWVIPKGIQNKLEELDTKYGPVYISKVIMGGSTFLSIEYDSVFVADTLHIDGSIDVDISSGLLNVKAGVTAGYDKRAESIMENSKSTFTIRGGDDVKRSNLWNALTLKETKINQEVTKDINIDSVHTALKEWSASIPNGEPTLENKKLYVPLKYGYSPIWDFLGDDYSALVKEYFIRKYRKKNTFVNLEEM